MLPIPKPGDIVTLPYLLGYRDRRITVTEIAAQPHPHAGIPDSPMVFFGKGVHRRSGLIIDFHATPDGSCSM